MDVRIKAKKVNIVTLTKKESEVVQLASEDLSNTEISIAMGVSIRTVEMHKYNILKKTGCRTMAGLLPILFRQGLLK